jgi:hypothetical protein
MIRVEIIANHSVEENILEAFQVEGVAKYYTKFPSIFGVGSAGPRMGDAIWPEENFAIVVWCEKDEVEGIERAIAAVKQQFPDEGIKLFKMEPSFVSEPKVVTIPQVVVVPPVPPSAGPAWAPQASSVAAFAEPLVEASSVMPSALSLAAFVEPPVEAVALPVAAFAEPLVEAVALPVAAFAEPLVEASSALPLTNTEPAAVAESLFEIYESESPESVVGPEFFAGEMAFEASTPPPPEATDEAPLEEPAGEQLSQSEQEQLWVSPPPVRGMEDENS